jgi:hypothetical protein
VIKTSHIEYELTNWAETPVNIRKFSSNQRSSERRTQKRREHFCGTFMFIINKRNSKEINQNVFLLS